MTAPLRENNAPGLVLPEFVGGSRLWLAPEVADIKHRLHHGDPTLGWAGDPRLELYLDPDGSWSLRRMEADGTLSRVCRSRPGLPLDSRLIQHLVKIDVQNGADPVAFVEEQARLAQEQTDSDELSEARERVLHAVRKDMDS